MLLEIVLFLAKKGSRLNVRVLQCAFIHCYMFCNYAKVAISPKLLNNGQIQFCTDDSHTWAGFGEGEGRLIRHCHFEAQLMDLCCHFHVKAAISSSHCGSTMLWSFSNLVLERVGTKASLRCSLT